MENIPDTAALPRTKPAFDQDPHRVREITERNLEAAIGREVRNFRRQQGMTVADLAAITGLSMAARAQPVEDRAEAEKVLRMLPLKYAEAKPLPMPMPTPDDVRLFRVTPTVISVLDYTQGFGHTDLVHC